MKASSRQLPTNKQRLPRTSRVGFTLIEVLIYVSLTAIVVGLLSGILITATRIQGQQTSSIDITKELSFLMSTIKRHVHSAIEYTTTQTELTLNVGSGLEEIITYDPVLKTVKLNEIDPVSGSSESQLSSDNIVIDNLLFTDLRQGSSTAVQITITASASTTNPQNAVSRTVQSTAAVYVQEQ